MPTDKPICQAGTTLIAMRVNIAMGLVNGIKLHTTISVLSTLPLVTLNTTIISAAMKISVMGIAAVLMSSGLPTVLPTAPYIKAYMKKPSTKNSSMYNTSSNGILNADEIIALPCQ